MFDHAIEIILKRKADEVVFLELKEGKKIELNGALLDSSVPVPIMFKYVVDKVKGISDADIQVNSIIEAMIFILGIDSQFPYKDQYTVFLNNAIDDVLELIRHRAAEALENERYIDAAIFCKAARFFDQENEQMVFMYARCLELAAENMTDDQNTVKILEEEAHDVLMYLVQTYPEMALPYYHLGFHLVNRKSYKAAQGIWERAVALGLDDDAKADILKNLTDLWSRIQYEEGYTYVLEGFPDEGLIKLLPLEEDNPEWWNLMFFIGLAYRQKQDYDNAIYYYKRTLNLNTGHVDTFNEIGLCYMGMGRFDEADEYFKEALRLDPENSELLCNLGIVHLNRGELREAYELIKKANSIDPSDNVTESWLRYIEQAIQQ